MSHVLGPRPRPEITIYSSINWIFTLKHQFTVVKRPCTCQGQ